MTSKLRFVLASLFMVASMFVMVSCGSEGAADKAMEKTENAVDAAADAVKDAAEATKDAATDAVDAAADAMKGKEYTSAYICPMHCEGSGAAEMGKCPTCGMDYVENKKEDNHEGHDHDHGSHDGHDHGSHEGHSH